MGEGTRQEAGPAVTRRAATDAAKATMALDLSQFPEIPKSLRAQIRAYLLWVAHRYPKAMGSQKDAAEYLGKSIPTIQRYQYLLERAGLLGVEVNSGLNRRQGAWRTNVYRLRYLNRPSSVMAETAIISEGQRDTPKGVSQERKKASPSSLKEGKMAKHASPEENLEAVGMVSKWKDDPDNPENWMREQAIGEPDEPKAGAVLRQDPAVVLSKHFERQWKSTLLRRKPEYRGVKWGDRGPSVGYLRSQMLDHLGYDHVESMIDTFTVAFCDDEVALRDGQTAWQCFVGWWGTASVPDPAVRRAEQAEYNAAMAQYRKMFPEG
jgi:hypothetical protein